MLFSLFDFKLWIDFEICFHLTDDLLELSLR